MAVAVHPHLVHVAVKLFELRFLLRIQDLVSLVHFASMLEHAGRLELLDLGDDGLRLGLVEGIGSDDSVELLMKALHLGVGLFEFLAASAVNLLNLGDLRVRQVECGGHKSHPVIIARVLLGGPDAHECCDQQRRRGDRVFPDSHLVHPPQIPLRTGHQLSDNVSDHRLQEMEVKCGRNYVKFSDCATL